MVDSFKTIAIGASIVLLLYYFFGYKVLLGILVLMLTALGLIYFNQNKLLYMPVIPNAPLSPRQNPYGYRHPSQHALISEDVTIKTMDNLLLRGWLVKGQNTKRVIVYFQQNAGNIGFRIPFIKNIHTRTNSDVLLVAYRGYSESEGTPTQLGLQLDSQAVLDWVIQYKNRQLIEGRQKKIYVLGRSLGGAVTIYISTKDAYKREISGVILENTFTSISDMIDCIFPLLTHFKFLQKNYWKSIERIPLLELPVLFIRSLRDQLVPTNQMVALIRKATKAKSKMQYQIKNGTHNESWSLEPEQYFEKYLDFFENNEKQTHH